MSATQLFEAVDTYINSLFAADDEILSRAVERARKAGLPEIQVSSGQGKLIYLRSRSQRTRRSSWKKELKRKLLRS